MAGAASLTLALRDLVSPQGRLNAFRAVTDRVYGPCAPGQVASWRPKPYEENKSRYLWTDAFGVCNYITLACETGERQFLDQADVLITAVHDTLGRSRSGKHRLGGATDEEPTRGGLRIGKAHPEGHRDGDGQYFHYLTYDSQDPLDLGEALWLSHWGLPDQDWALMVSERSLDLLEELWGGGYFRMPEHFRLAFREFGTTLGVQVNRLAGEAWQQRVAQLHRVWAGQLFGRDADITPVMFCSSLVPGAWSKEYSGRLKQLGSQAARGSAE